MRQLGLPGDGGPFDEEGQSMSGLKRIEH